LILTQVSSTRQDRPAGLAKRSQRSRIRAHSVESPTHDRRVRQGESTFGHHLHEITKAEFVAQILAHAEDDYFAIEMAAFEEFVHVEHSSALSFEQSAGKLCCVNPVPTRADLWTAKNKRVVGTPSVHSFRLAERADRRARSGGTEL
jgi:hypothetical protein